MRHLPILVVLAGLVAGAAIADDIVTMPTANSLKKGEMDFATYYLNLNLPAAAPQSVLYQTLYYGVTNRLELDLHRADVNKDKDSVIGVVNYKFLSEQGGPIDAVVGVRNVTGEKTTYAPGIAGRSADQSFYLAMAKTAFLNPSKPGAPLVRIHLGVGTQDWTLLGEKRHQGAFGGLQFLFHPAFGAVIENDGRDTIAGLTLMPKNSGLTIKGGTYGKHTWVGLALRKQM